MYSMAGIPTCCVWIYIDRYINIKVAYVPALTIPHLVWILSLPQCIEVGTNFILFTVGASSNVGTKVRVTTNNCIVKEIAGSLRIPT